MRWPAVILTMMVVPLLVLLPVLLSSLQLPMPGLVVLLRLLLPLLAAAEAANQAAATTPVTPVTPSTLVVGTVRTPAAPISSDISVYDALGNAHTVTLNWVKNPGLPSDWTGADQRARQYPAQQPAADRGSRPM